MSLCRGLFCYAKLGLMQCDIDGTEQIKSQESVVLAFHKLVHIIFYLMLTCRLTHMLTDLCC